ncbi:17322_t:CDS:1 [Acaulospora morrowiae]|uniref:17322_t:CDS:1 n=1 Tax=Acaulospora morrowiae TaxID=94023 RepID=A0A9N9A9D1_9GLOM|nr:17322_t:CDS:1 [Acaulospora morrowiae]
MFTSLFEMWKVEEICDLFLTDNTKLRRVLFALLFSELFHALAHLKVLLSIRFPNGHYTAKQLWNRSFYFLCDILSVVVSCMVLNLIFVDNGDLEGRDKHGYIFVRLNKDEMKLLHPITTILAAGHFLLHFFYISGWFSGYWTYLKNQRRESKARENKSIGIDGVDDKGSTKSNTITTSPQDTAHLQKKREPENNDLIDFDGEPTIPLSTEESKTATQLFLTLDESVVCENSGDTFFTCESTFSTMIETSITRDSISRRNNANDTEITDKKSRDDEILSDHANFLGNKFVRNVLVWSAAQGWEAKKKTKWHWWHTIGTCYDILVHTVTFCWLARALGDL